MPAVYGRYNSCDGFLRYVSLITPFRTLQVELGDVRKVLFRLGLKKQNPAELAEDGDGDENEDDVEAVL
jgi:hypothetical protein